MTEPKVVLLPEGTLRLAEQAACLTSRYLETLERTQYTKLTTAQCAALACAVMPEVLRQADLVQAAAAELTASEWLKEQNKVTFTDPPLTACGAVNPEGSSLCGLEPHGNAVPHSWESVSGG